jgi:steroid delta-isomerase-like uncharacterized protein
MADGVKLMREWYEGVDGHDLDRVLAACAPDCEVVAPGVTVKGREEIRAFLQGFLDAMPDIEHRTQHITAADDDLVVVELTGYGTHTGNLSSPDGPIAPTGKSVELRSCGVSKIADGKIASYHLYWDQMQFLGQLGLL